MKKKIISLILVLAMVFPLCPVGLFSISVYASTNESWLWPTLSPQGITITSSFGYRNTSNDTHKAIDIKCAMGTAVLATKSGTVYSCVQKYGSAEKTSSGGTESWGNYIILKHKDGTYSLYAHLSQDTRTVSKGKEIKQGDIIAYSGDSGHSTGPHLHFSARTYFGSAWSNVDGLINVMPTEDFIEKHNMSYTRYELPDGWPSTRMAYSVTSHATHSYTTVGYDSAHPHNEYKSCFCGAKTYTGNTKKVSGCTTCYPTNEYTSTNPDDYAYPERSLTYTSPTMKGADVAWVQAVLYQLGYSIDIDGSYGKGSVATIKTFQSDYGLEVDGHCGPATLAQLKELWEAKKCSHSYDNACDATCNRCGATRTPAAHVYTNACDEYCNICFALRYVPGHSYSNACDASCNICGATRTPAAHKYDNNCDTSCNVCGATRTITHSYTTVGYDKTHPHNEYKRCSCGEIQYTGAEQNAWDETLHHDEAHPHSIYKLCIPCGWKKYTGKKATVSSCVDCYPGGTTGDCTWKLVGTKLTISGNGAMADYTDSNPAPWGTAITEVVIENGVTSIGNQALEDCGNLTSIVIPDSVKNIGEFAFYNCKALKSAILGNGIETIGNFAFRKCTALPAITIPKSVTSIGSVPFSICDAMTSITVDEGNKIYHSAGNCLIETSSKTLIQGCKTSVIPADNSIIAINKHAFYNCNDLTSIIIPDGVTSIGEGAFYNCGDLTSTTIPDSVTSIGDWTFYDCTVLTDVWYEGTEADRAKISIGSDNEYLINATWHYDSCIKNAPSYTHVYDNACDTTCNICGEKRSVTHTYDNACDAECNVCKVTRTPADHVYDNKEDKTCNVCGASREENFELTVTLSKSDVAHGDTFTVSVALSKPIIVRGFGLDFSGIYDNDSFEWVSGDWSQTIKSNSLMAPVNPGTQAVFAGQAEVEIFGEIFTFTLRAKDSAMCGSKKIDAPTITQIENVTSVGATIIVDHIYDNAKDFVCNVCGYERPAYTPGDLDGVRGVSMDDAIYLLFHVNFPGSYPINQPANFNGLGETDMDDAIYLLFHVNFPVSYPLH